MIERKVITITKVNGKDIAIARLCSLNSTAYYGKTSRGLMLLLVHRIFKWIRRLII